MTIKTETETLSQRFGLTTSQVCKLGIEEWRKLYPELLAVSWVIENAKRRGLTHSQLLLNVRQAQIRIDQKK